MTHSTVKQYLFDVNDLYGQPLTLRTVNVVSFNYPHIVNDDEFLRHGLDDWKRMEGVHKSTLKELQSLKNRMLGKEVRYVNLLPYPIRLPNGTIIRPQIYPRPSVTSSQANYDDNFLAQVALGGVANLPPPIENCVYITSPEVVLATPMRRDLYFPTYINDGKNRKGKMTRPVKGLCRYLVMGEVTTVE